MKSPLAVTVEEPHSGARHTYVFRRSPVVVGRDDRACDLVLVRSSVSNIHAEITFDDGKVTFRDLDSRNGSLIDGARIPAEADVPVSLDSAIVIGGSLRLTFSRDAAPNADSFANPFSGPIPEVRAAEHTEAYTGPPIAPRAAHPEPKAASGLLDHAPQPRRTPSNADHDVGAPIREIRELEYASPAPATRKAAAPFVGRASEPSGSPPDPSGGLGLAEPPHLDHDPPAPVIQQLMDDGLTVAEPARRFDWSEVGPAPERPLPPTILPPPPPEAALEPSPSEQVKVGDVVAHYRVERLIARGGMGAIFEVSHTRASAKRFALKVLAREVIGHPEAEPRFLREAEAASRITHPHVVTMVDFGKDRGIIYLVLELLEGTDLADLIQRRPNLPVERIADIMLAVCSGVAAAHDLGIIHRDLKPQNIFLQRTATGDTVPKVLDFGISKMRDRALGAGATRGFSLLGTPNYLSPEQAEGDRRVDLRCDVYALGAILFECATGRPAHEGRSLFALLRSIVEAKYPRPSDLRPELPSDFEAVVLRAMERDPDQRFETVRDLGRALLPFASPKRQAFWTDYYVNRAREQDESGFDVMPISLSRHASQVPHLYAAGGTRLLPEAEPPRSDYTFVTAKPASSAPKADASRISRQTPLPIRRRRSPIMIAAIVLAAVTTVAAAVTLLTPAPTETAPSAAPPPPAPVQPPSPQPTNAPAPTPPPPTASEGPSSPTPAAETTPRRSRRQRTLDRSRGGVPDSRP